MPVVIKRDGCNVPYDLKRIKSAIISAEKAVNIVDTQYAQTVADAITKQFAEQSKVEIYDIQSAVENMLMSGPYKEMARAYIEYRHDRDIAREKRGQLNHEIKGLVEQSNTDIIHPFFLCSIVC